ncbi:MAG: helix-turn-helix transcriptional regulator [Phycisphaerales bacterium]|nr:helix-turn-helix transcriptional regulator [Phycisphaerales bacterium]
MTDQPRAFGQVLRERRIAKGYSLRKFAEMVGVSPTYLSQVEQDKVEKPPTAERVRRMAELLGESVDELSALADRVPEDLPGSWCTRRGRSGAGIRTLSPSLRFGPAAPAPRN